MSDPIAKLVLENFQPRPGRGSWHGGPTPVGALRGVAPEQAAWTPATGRKSIWQLALHMAYWNYAVRRRLEGGSGARFPRTPANQPRVPTPADARAWAEDVALFKQEHEQLVAVIAAVPPSRYGDRLPGGKRWTKGELILGIAQHDAYHTARFSCSRDCGRVDDDEGDKRTPGPDPHEYHGPIRPLRGRIVSRTARTM